MSRSTSVLYYTTTFDVKKCNLHKWVKHFTWDAGDSLAKFPAHNSNKFFYKLFLYCTSIDNRFFLENYEMKQVSGTSFGEYKFFETNLKHFSKFDAIV